MGREVKRVPLDFDHPIGKVWGGYLMPEALREERCPDCDGTGYSSDARHLQDLWYGNMPFDPTDTGSVRLTPETPAVRAFAERNVARSPEFYGTTEAAVTREAARLADYWNGAWSHHLEQADVDALIEGDRLWDFTHTWTKGKGWEPIDPTPTVPAEQVNAWSLGGFGHDGINCHVVIRSKCKRLGLPELCSSCQGHATTERYEGQRAEADAWAATGPPEGEGWQLWETVSEGSPVSPVLTTADALAEWMADPARGDRWLPLPAAQRFVEEGWAPSLAVTPEAGVQSGTEWVGMQDRGEVAP